MITITKPEPGIAFLHMQDTEHNNTFTGEFVEALMDKLAELARDRDLKVVVLCGLSGIFSAGASKEGLLKFAEGKNSVKELLLPEAVMNLPVPVIAAMEGGALGGGFVLGLCCDIVILAERSMYGVNFMELGFTPGMGCTQLLKELVGPFVAAEMMFTAKMYKGRTFRDRGFVNYILPQAEVLPKALLLAQSIAEKPRKTLEILKNYLVLKKRQALVEARIAEDQLHTISFAQPEVKAIITSAYRG